MSVQESCIQNRRRGEERAHGHDSVPVEEADSLADAAICRRRWPLSRRRQRGATWTSPHIKAVSAHELDRPCQLDLEQPLPVSSVQSTSFSTSSQD
jgi:hypothetical protein